MTECEKREIAKVLEGNIYLDGYPASIYGFKLSFAEVIAKVSGRVLAATFSWRTLERAVERKALPLMLLS